MLILVVILNNIFHKLIVITSTFHTFVKHFNTFIKVQKCIQIAIFD